jgi:hypothetical protein
MSERKNDFHSGHIWSEIRWGLSQYRERLIQAFDSGSYEAESAILDDVARHITVKVEPMVKNYAERGSEALIAKEG